MIDFTKTFQIFYPFSNQIWFNTFPGTSIDDCPRDLSKEEALQLNCSNAEHPDTYGHYRETKVSQIKHHWWWKLNFIMEHLSFTKQHQGDVMMLEEDHYVSTDFIYMWKKMKSIQNDMQTSSDVNDVDILTLGNYEKKFNIKKDLAGKLNLSKWLSNRHNMAFTIDRRLWNKIKSCQSNFCTYDDYNWDWSLQFINDNCLKSKLSTLVVVIPRVYHTGTCGLHHQNKKCDEKLESDKLDKFLKENRQYLFPENIHVQKRLIVSKKMKNNGGWSDPRDHQLCKQYRFNTIDILKKNPNFNSYPELKETFKLLLTNNN